VRTAVSLVRSAASAAQLAATSVRRSPAHELPSYSQHIWRFLVTAENGPPPLNHFCQARMDDTLNDPVTTEAILVAPSERWRSGGWDHEFESPLLHRRVRCEPVSRTIRRERLAAEQLFHFVLGEPLLRPVVKLGRAGALVRRRLLRMLKRAASCVRRPAARWPGRTAHRRCARGRCGTAKIRVRARLSHIACPGTDKLPSRSE
jgi:hypothetical protein